MFTVLDVETNKLMRRDLDEAHPEQPYIVDAAAMLCTPDGIVVDCIKRRARLPEGVAIQAAAEAVHGISTRAARRSGADQRWLMFGLIEMFNESSAVVSYGGFDRAVGASMIERIAGAKSGVWMSSWTRPGLRWESLIEAAAIACKIPSDHESGSYRWPSLDVACQKILGDPPRDGFHNALDDCDRARRLYLALRDGGLLSQPPALKVDLDAIRISRLRALNERIAWSQAQIEKVLAA